MNNQSMPSPTQPGKAQRRGECVGTVSAQINSVLLASSGHFQKKVTVRIEDRRHSRGVVVATFGKSKIEAHTITRHDQVLRLEHQLTHQERVLRTYWIEISAADWANLLAKAPIQESNILGMGPEPTPLPPAPPAPPLNHALLPHLFNTLSQTEGM